MLLSLNFCVCVWFLVGFCLFCLIPFVSLVFFFLGFLGYGLRFYNLFVLGCFSILLRLFTVYSD